MTPETSAAILIPLLIAGLAGWIRWSIRTAVEHTVRETVNGGLSRIQATVTGVAEGQAHLEERIEAHDRRHGHEQLQLMAALSRQGVEPPDGWRRRGGD